VSTADVELTRASTKFTLNVAADECKEPKLVLRVSEGDASRILTPPLTAVEGGFELSVQRGFFEPEPGTCLLDRELTLEAELDCDVDDRRTIAEAITVRERTSLPLTALEAPGSGRQPLFRRANSEPLGNERWVGEDESVRAFSPSLGAAGRSLLLSHARTAILAPVVVRSATHSYLPIECNEFCAPVFVMDNLGTGRLANTQYILVVPHALAGRKDARKDVARVAVAGRVVDIGVSEGTLYILSQLDDTVVLSSFVEQTNPPLDGVLTADAKLLPYSVALSLQRGPSGGLVALVGPDGVVPNGFVGYSPGLAKEEPQLPCPGGAPPVPYPAVGGSGSGAGGSGTSGGHIPASSGDEAGANNGCLTVKSNIIVASFDVKRDEGVVLEATGDYVSAADRLLLLYRTSSAKHAALLYDNVARTSRWLRFPSADGASPVVDRITTMSVAPDSSRFLLTTTRGVFVFSRDGEWLEGVVVLPAACGSPLDSYFTTTSAWHVETEALRFSAYDTP
jgi:hypothetical protein